jgi:hypothetical protein
MKTIFLRVLEADDKAATLHTAIDELGAVGSKLCFEVDTARFGAVPRSPFAYWAGARVRSLFLEEQPLEAPEADRIARRGVGTNDDFRFLRLWTEVVGTCKDWRSLAKGGIFSRFYASLPLVLNWQNDGAQLRAFFIHNGESPSRNIRSESEYYRPGLTWPLRTQGGLALRAMPAGCIFGSKGPAIFARHDDTESLLALLAVTNARPFRALVDLQMAFGSYEVGVIQRTPIPRIGPVDQSTLAALARLAWSKKRSLDACTEASHAFVLPALLLVQGDTLIQRTAAWSERVRVTEAALSAIQADIDVRTFDLYGIDEPDRIAINEGFGSGDAGSETPDNADAEADADDEADDQGKADAASLSARLISWAIGVAFGRFDVRNATGARQLPVEPEPFDRLPVCSPAMLIGDEGSPLASAPSGYPITFPGDGILVDDPGHLRDVTAAARMVFEEVFEASSDAWWNDVSAMLDAKGRDLRTWLAAGFFEHHLKRHSMSRRKAPIVWQLAVPSGRYSIWLYAHRLNRDTFLQIQNDVVTPKIAHEERQLASSLQSATAGVGDHERKMIETQQGFVEELRELLDEVKRVAPLWNPSLGDGAVLTMAPLWRLVPQHKPWQKELKSKWDELVAGKYDWAHVAMHLWPERVVPKCLTDRSLAISHGLEDVFWLRDSKEKWRPIDKPEKLVANLVRERTSPAVKAALKSLLEAPDPASVSKRRRKSKAA